MTCHARHLSEFDSETLLAEARRVLRRLTERDTVLVAGTELEMAAILRLGGRTPVRLAVTTRAFAEAFALQDWIALATRGRVCQYRLTEAGRAVLKRAEQAGSGAQSFADQHRDYHMRDIPEVSAQGRPVLVRHRVNLAESPLGALARRRDKDGQPFLSEDLIAAGERLREDFELAQMGPRVAQNWDKFLTAGVRQPLRAGDGPGGGSEGARARVQAALSELGPGLGDVVLRCCCFLEGLESTEKTLGWSARSGKIVLRIALQRLVRHYAAQIGGKTARD